jgi:hypothetical protein
MADISTDFKPVEAGLYNFTIEKVEEVKKNNELVGYRVHSKIDSGSVQEMVGRVFRDYISIVTKKGEINEIGLASLKRYFEVTFGKETVSEWTDDDYDTDYLVGRQWSGQLEVSSYTPDGETEPRKNNKVKRMDAVG